MASIDQLKASDGTGNASVATVQSTRAAAATTIVVDTVANINTNFIGSMGTPHTFVDPVTSETITVISEATAVDFKGHVDGSNLEIDTIAPGYTDAGSAVGDIVIIKPTTQGQDALAEVLEVAHNDDGTLKDNTVDADVVTVGAVVQVVNAVFSAAGITTTTTPLDDTIPQNNEGFEVMTLAITPKSTTNILVIEVKAYCSNSAAGGHMIGALFQDSTANALAACAQYTAPAGSSAIVSFTHVMTAGTTSATTFKVRVGCNAVGTTTFNGLASGRFFGAIPKSSIVITEYKA